ncbi:MAG: HPr family phosphocarrier protein [Firmicutes bacterium HGW-Firmicutes-2]|jgi:phosphocarrier protein|nr:MAG: HPr family phosphocarrier protein [Firmicutes bacterium HGW-Firmicutes-2]
MKSFTIIVPFEEGLHARPASQLVKVCQSAKSDIKIIKGTTEVNPKSILGILTLGAKYNDTLTMEISGEDEDEVVQKINNFFEV